MSAPTSSSSRSEMRGKSFGGFPRLPRFVSIRSEEPLSLWLSSIHLFHSPSATVSRCYDGAGQAATTGATVVRDRAPSKPPVSASRRRLRPRRLWGGLGSARPNRPVPPERRSHPGGPDAGAARGGRVWHRPPLRGLATCSGRGWGSTDPAGMWRSSFGVGCGQRGEQAGREGLPSLRPTLPVLWGSSPFSCRIHPYDLREEELAPVRL
jgi:hypothetical protein